MRKYDIFKADTYTPKRKSTSESEIMTRALYKIWDACLENIWVRVSFSSTSYVRRKKISTKMFFNSVNIAAICFRMF